MKEFSDSPSSSFNDLPSLPSEPVEFRDVYPVPDLLPGLPTSDLDSHNTNTLSLDNASEHSDDPHSSPEATPAQAASHPSHDSDSSLPVPTDEPQGIMPHEEVAEISTIDQSNVAAVEQYMETKTSAPPEVASESSVLHQMPDMLQSSPSAVDYPREAYFFVQNTIMDLISNYERSILAAPPPEDGLEHWVALEKQLTTSLAAVDPVPSVVVERQADYYETSQSELAREGVDIRSAFQSAQELTSAETTEHFVAKLSAYPEQLQAPADSTVKAPEHYVGMAEALLVTARYNPDFAANDTTAKVEQQLGSISSLLIDAGKVGLALSFGKLITESQRTDQFIDAITNKLHELRAIEGEHNYRQVYNHAMATLPEYHRKRFLQRLPKKATPLIPGSERELITRDDGDVMNERFEERTPVSAALQDGRLVAMPNIDYRERLILGYGTVRETEIYGEQIGVEYEALPDDAKAAVEVGIMVTDEERLRTETLPYYKRLALWRKEEGDTLYTVAPKDRIFRPMFRYPDHNVLVASDSERQLDFPVEAIELITSTYMALPYDGGHIWSQTLDDCEPNFFGPGEDVANAFWITGSPRVVHSKTDSRLTVATKYGTSARFVIVPVCYYNIKEDKEAS